METEQGGYGYGGICGWFVANRWSKEGDIGGLTKEIDGLKKEGDIGGLKKEIDGLKKVPVGSLDAMVGLYMRCDAVVGGLRKEIDGLKKVSVGSLDVMVGMVGTIVKGKGRGMEKAEVGRHREREKMVYCVFWVDYVFFAGLIFFFFNIVLTWKIVGASKASVLYIYIDEWLFLMNSYSSKLGIIISYQKH